MLNPSNIAQNQGFGYAMDGLIKTSRFFLNLVFNISAIVDDFSCEISIFQS